VRALAEIEEQNDRLLHSIRGELPRDETVIAIASGSITRERSCEGKKSYRTPQFAETIRQKMQRKYSSDFHFYHCQFCLCYHVASGNA